MAEYLFIVIGELEKDVSPDADHLFSLLQPNYSQEGVLHQDDALKRTSWTSF